ncbi:MAG: glycosyltransferase, partial [Chloroflexota bacterium]|nr:glycosyltransferase [Chloroflexota bacterium]
MIVVNDGSLDRTAAIASSYTGVQLINLPNGGAARATNVGVEKARYDIVVSLDADAVLNREWLQQIMPLFDDPQVAVVGGYAQTGNKSTIGRLMGYDVEQRMDRIQGNTDHLYTMN